MAARERRIEVWHELHHLGCKALQYGKWRVGMECSDEVRVSCRVGNEESRVLTITIRDEGGLPSDVRLEAALAAAKVMEAGMGERGGDSAT